MNLNRVELIGNVTRDPELKSTPNGRAVVQFSIATSYTYKDQQGGKVEKTEFHNLVAWAKLAEIIGQYVRKGSKLFVAGRLSTRNYEKDGQKHYRTEIIVEDMIMLNKAPDQNNHQNQGVGSYGDGGPTNNTPDEINLEDIPF